MYYVCVRMSVLLHTGAMEIENCILVCVCVCTCMCMYVYVYVCDRELCIMYVYVYTIMYVRMCTYVYVHIINYRCACAASVTVLGLYVCVSALICRLTHWNHKREIPTDSSQYGKDKKR